MRTMLEFAGKSLIGRRRRFFFLGLAVAFGFMIMTVTTGLTEGLLSTVRQKGALYFSGNVNVTCYAKGGYDDAMDGRLLLESVRESLGNVTILQRTIYYGTDAQLFFGGATVRQRRVAGIDWAAERKIADSLYIVAGSFPEDGDARAVLISETAAKRLGARVGDDLTLLISSEGGRNTGTFVLRGIFRDSSIFGYATYISRPAMNALLAVPADYITDLGLILRRGQNENRTAERIRAAIAKRADVFPVAYSRDELQSMSRGDWAGKRYMVCTLDAHLSDIKQVLDALMAICYALLAAFLAIVLFGIANTYRVVIFQRSSEIGMMRAIGMSKTRAMWIFIEEAGLLSVISVAVGLGAGMLALFGISRLSMPPGLDMFLRNGRIAWALDFNDIIGISIVVCATTLVAAWFPARRAARILPVEAMRTED
jgi:ABC-type lipoprotein release transport system permease subunit